MFGINKGVISKLLLPPSCLAAPFWMAIDNTKFGHNKPNCTLLPDEKMIYEQLKNVLPWPLVAITINYFKSQMVYLVDANGLHSLELGTNILTDLCKTPHNEFESVFVDPSNRSVLLTTYENVYRYNHTSALSPICVANASGINVTTLTTNELYFPRIANVSSCGNIIICMCRPNSCVQLINLRTNTIQTINSRLLDCPFMAIQDPFDTSTSTSSSLLITCLTGLHRLDLNLNQQNQTKIGLATDVVASDGFVNTFVDATRVSLLNIKHDLLRNCNNFKGIVTTPSKWCIFSSIDYSEYSYVFAYNSRTNQLVHLATRSADLGLIENILYVSPLEKGGSPVLLFPIYQAKGSIGSLTLDPFFDVPPS